jgi:hypothetical protein
VLAATQPSMPPCGCNGGGWVPVLIEGAVEVVPGSALSWVSGLALVAAGVFLLIGRAQQQQQRE